MYFWCLTDRFFAISIFVRLEDFNIWTFLEHLPQLAAAEVPRFGWFSSFETTKKCLGPWKSGRECRNHARIIANRKFGKFYIGIISKLFFSTSKKYFFSSSEKKSEKCSRTKNRHENFWKSETWFLKIPSWREKNFFTFQKKSKKYFFAIFKLL